MTPEAGRFLEKADKCRANAKASLTINLTNDAGRSAYLAAFHAAQALIFERTGKIAKTHKGVHSEFARLAAAAQEFDSLPAFLLRAYNLKAVADYETGPDSEIPLHRAVTAAGDADNFVAVIRRALATQSQIPARHD